MQAKDLSKHYDLHFVTSSLAKKEEATAIKLKLEQDSIRVPLATLEAPKSRSDNIPDTDQTRTVRPHAPSKIAASAASYVQSRAKDLLSFGCETEENDHDDCCIRGDASQRAGASPGVHKSEVAAFVATTTVTAVVAAGEKERQEAAKQLQSLHSSPCEWFICDDLSTYTRCFVIQVPFSHMYNPACVFGK